MKELKIWVLGDNRPGNTNQAMALAEGLSSDYALKKIEYNRLGKMPNWMLKIYPIHVKRKLLNKLTAHPAPDLIITSGRRTAPIALYLKKKFLNKVKLIQIMQPDLPYKEFEWIILPMHDVSKDATKNIVRITGALANIHSKLKIEGKKLRENYPALGKFTAVIVGGNSKNYTFTDENALSFAGLLKQIADQDFFVSFSRRTPNSVKQIIKDTLPASTIIYDPLEPSIFNPYLGILAEADYIISTNDSISMCSEAASTGKPLYIFCPHNFKSLKHKFFVKQLIEQGIAKIFDESVTSLKKYNYEPLNEVKRVSKYIKFSQNSHT